MESAEEASAGEVSLAARLGADAAVWTQCFSVYVPNKDLNGREIGNQRKWVLEALGLLSEINGGAMRIRDTSATEPRLDPAVIAAALEGEPTPLRLTRALSPLTLFAVRQELAARLQASGTSVTTAADISLSDAEWRELQKLAVRASTPGRVFSAAQVAGALLGASLRALAGEADRETGHPNPEAAKAH